MSWGVIGQPRAVSLLRRSLDTGNLSHAYLFAGPAHTGKMKLAFSLAQAVNCEASSRPCGECPSCIKIAAGRHTDVQVIDLNGEGSDENRTRIAVSQVEDLQRSANLPPFEGRRKVFIMDGAEFLSIGAANRLLKTLEEPPAVVLFILLAVDEKPVPQTIMSRCQRVDLFPVPAARIEEALATEWSVEAGKARLLSRVAHGCVDTAVSLAGDERLLQQRDENLESLIEAIYGDGEDRFAYAARMAAQFSQNRNAVYAGLDSWMEWWRDLMLIKAGAAGEITNIDRTEVLTDMAAGLGLAQTGDFIHSIRAAAERLRQNASPKVVLEVLMLDMPEVVEPAKIR